MASDGTRGMVLTSGRLQRGFRLARGRAKNVCDQIPEATRENHAEAVNFVDQLARPAVIGQRLWKLKLEGIEGILERPHGCGEQTISSTYPNVMALRYLRGQDESSAALAAKARRYIKAGYDRLLGYRAASGGFSYWGRRPRIRRSGQ